MNLSILRNTVEVASVSIDDKTKFEETKMGKHTITSTFVVSQKIDLLIGDYIDFEGEQFKMNNIPVIKEKSNTSFEYTVLFEGQRYSLANKKFKDEGDSEFSYYGDAEFHLNLLLTNINSIDAGWTLGTVEPTESKTIRYDSVYCREALNKIAEEFDLEWKLTGKEITMLPSVSNDTAHLFKYGRGNGLYSLTQRPVDSTNVVTRWYGYGSTTNISKDYRNGAKRLVFPEKYIDVDVDLYGVREGDYIDESVFPQRTGIVSAIDVDSVYKIIDASINFDINDYLLEGVEAQIVFKTGALAGYEFEVNRYDHTSKEITFTKFVEENDYELPNDLNKPNIGDAYTLINIKMPTGYETTAEAEIKQKTIDWANNNRLPVIYDLNLDPKDLRAKGISLKVSDKVTVQSDNLGIDELIEIQTISYPLVEVSLKKVVLSNTSIIDSRVQATKIINEAPKRIKKTAKEAIERARQEIVNRKRNEGTLMLRGEFDADTIYYNDNKRTDVVFYNLKSWYYVGLNEVAQAWNNDNWEEFGYQIEVLATNTLLSEEANIADWKIKNSKITSSQEYSAGVPRAQWDGSTGKITLKAAKNTYNQSGGAESYDQTIEIDPLAGRITAEHSGDSNQLGGVAYFDSEGIFANFAGVQAISASTGVEIKSAIVGLGFGKMTKAAFAGADDCIVGVYGNAVNSASNPAPAYGGYFWNLMARGFNMSVNSITGTASSHTIARSTVVTTCYNTAATTLYLPLSPLVGQTHYIKKMNSSGVTINGNGKSLFRTSVITSQSIPDRDCFICTFDGAYWILMRTN